MRYQPSANPADQKILPREKMLQHGVRLLRDDELLAIILGTGVRRRKQTLGVETLAKLLIKDFGLRGLFTGFNDPNELAGTAELPRVKSCVLTAVGELFRRLKQKDRLVIGSPEDAQRYFADLQQAEKEQVRIACLTPENLVFYVETAALGDAHGLNCPLINIFHPAARFYAQRILVAHNHPRGKAVPSEQDRAWHAELLKAAALLNIEIVDHVIVGAKDFFSFATEGLV